MTEFICQAPAAFSTVAISFVLGRSITTPYKFPISSPYPVQYRPPPSTTMPVCQQPVTPVTPVSTHSSPHWPYESVLVARSMPSCHLRCHAPVLTSASTATGCWDRFIAKVAPCSSSSQPSKAPRKRIPSNSQATCAAEESVLCLLPLTTSIPCPIHSRLCRHCTWTPSFSQLGNMLFTCKATLCSSRE